MELVIISLLVIVGVLELILAAMVLRTSYSRQNLFFGIFVIAAVLWSLGDALMLFSHDLHTVRIGTTLFLAAPLYTTLFVLYFTAVFPQHNTISRRFQLGFLLPTILITVVSIVSPGYFINIDNLTAPQNNLSVNGFPYFLYTLYFSVYLTYAVVLLGRRYFRSKGNMRPQIALSVIGIAISSVVSLISNLSMPLFGNMNWLWIGPVSTLGFIILVAVAIIKHRLFDIRSVIARALGYTFSLVVLSAVYGLIVLGAARYIFNLDIPVMPQIFLAAATGVAGLAFPVLRGAFDRLTNRLFYRDAYDAQELFGSLNSMLVSSLDMKYLMMQSISIIETALKPNFALIGLKDGDSGERIFASSKIEFPHSDIMRARKLTPNLLHHKVIVADDLDSPKQQDLKQLMQKHNIAVIVRLTQNTRSHEEGMGYLVLGIKKSGNPYTQQDINVLDTVGNELTIAIQNALHYEEIQQFNVQLQGRVDEATRKLRRTNEKLKALDETKDDFISMASHQLRTPLTSVKGYLSMVLEEDAGKINATQQKMLGQAFTSSQRMVYLIADLLNVSRLRTGKFVIDATPTNLATMIEEEMAQLVESAKARDLELTFDKPKDFPDIMLDETKTRQVVMNFIDNAIYYTPSGGHIKVELSSDNRTIDLRVSDDGIGVPKAEQHHLFTKFYRAGNAQKARPDGTGLGLFMAKKVVVAQGGSIIFDSSEGNGSTFGFSFSRNKLGVQPASPTPPIIKVVKTPAKKKA